MSDVLNRTTKEFRRSVHTPAFPPADWIVNPDLSAVVGQPIKYWLISGDAVSLADAGGQAAIDAAILAARVVVDKAAEKREFDDRRVLKAFAELIMNQFNTLRAQHALSDLTFSQLRTAIRGIIDAGT